MLSEVFCAILTNFHFFYVKSANFRGFCNTFATLVYSGFVWKFMLGKLSYVKMLILGDFATLRIV